MKARVKASGEVIDVRLVQDLSGNLFYEEIGVSAYSPQWYAYYRSELEFIGEVDKRIPKEGEI